MALFEPLQIRDVTLRSRIAVSPMCEYCAEDRGLEEHSLQDIDGNVYRFCEECWEHCLSCCDYCDKTLYRDIAIQVWVHEPKSIRYFLH